LASAESIPKADEQDLLIAWHPSKKRLQKEAIKTHHKIKGEERKQENEIQNSCKSFNEFFQHSS
jgi:hypothetical protein